MKICPHCKKSTTFMVTLVAQGKASLANDAYELVEQGDLGIQEGSLVCTECNNAVVEAQLVDGTACSQCGAIHPYEELLQLEGENGQPGAIICNPCYQAMCAQAQPQQEQAPTQEAPVQEQAPAVDPKDQIIAQQNEQMAQMMAQMQAMQAQMAQVMGGGQVAATANVPQQQPQVATNIPAPSAPVQQPVAQQPVQTQATVAPQQPANIINPGAPSETPTGGDIFGGEAPF